MRRSVRGTAFALAALLSIAAARTAAAEGPQPGLWKVTTKTQVPGAPARESSHTSCVTAEMAKNPGSDFTRAETSPRPDCKRTQQYAGSKLTWKIECTGQNAMTGEGSLTFDGPQHYSGSFQVSVSAAGRQMSFATTLEGQRVGECTK